MEVANTSFENMIKLKYSGTNLNYTHKENKSGFGDPCYHSVQNLPISSLKMFRIIILPIVLYGCETLSLAVTEERRLRVFVDRVLRSIFGLRT
jgi:hypothetical protein